ncbi:hypothetical protein DRN76_05275 [Methanosarcinales archaeon]|nr:MAG: hypothetical protein DRN76_05275 [Methanosarcinales archaeon]
MESPLLFDGLVGVRVTKDRCVRGGTVDDVAAARHVHVMGWRGCIVWVVLGSAGEQSGGDDEVIVMRILNLCIVVLVLMVAAGLIVAEPKHVDGGWHRSDGIPEETPTIVPVDDTQTSPMTTTEAQGGAIVSVSLLVKIAMVLFGIVFIIVIRKRRSR